MTQTEAIEAVKRGERIQMRCSLHPAELPTSPTCRHQWWRVIACNSDEDVVECSACGQQRVVGCGFDDDMA